MLRINLILAMAGMLLLGANSQAQNDDAARVKGLVQAESDSLGWTVGGGIGLDLGQILVLNPRAGSGQNRFGIGGAVGLYANKKTEMVTWNNNLTLNLAVEKTGSGVLPDPDGNPSEVKVPFKKSIDEIKLNSTFGYKVAEGSKWSYSASFGLRTQLLSSYQGIVDGQVYVSEVDIEDSQYENELVSKFFAPGRMALGVGMMYEPSDAFSLVINPLTADVIIISDQDIANLGVHGTELEDGSTDVYKTTRFAFGASVSAQYQQKFVSDRLAFKSRLTLFSDYLSNPQNIDVLWTNDLSFDIYKGLQLSLSTNLFYDDDVLSNITDFDAPGGIERGPDGDPILRPAVNYFHQLVIKYAWTF